MKTNIMALPQWKIDRPSILQYHIAQCQSTIKKTKSHLAFYNFDINVFNSRFETNLYDGEAVVMMLASAQRSTDAVFVSG